MRASEGTSGLGSLRVSEYDLAKMWIDVNKGWGSFTASEFLPGRNFGCKVLFNNGALIAIFTSERLKYLMSQVAPSGITGNASLGKLTYNENAQNVALNAIKAVFSKFNKKPHGMFTVDLKENENGIPCVTEINPRHIATTYVFTLGGANFSEWMVQTALGFPLDSIPGPMLFHQNPKYFLRHVDSLPILVDDIKGSEPGDVNNE